MILTEALWGGDESLGAFMETQIWSSNSGSKRSSSGTVRTINGSTSDAAHPFPDQFLLSSDNGFRMAARIKKSKRAPQKPGCL